MPVPCVKRALPTLGYTQSAPPPTLTRAPVQRLGAMTEDGPLPVVADLATRLAVVTRNIYSSKAGVTRVQRLTRTIEDEGRVYHVLNELFITKGAKYLVGHTYFARVGAVPVPASSESLFDVGRL